ncbi:MAG: sialidase [Planctomycetaceae bacterium]|nr:sialidase [Planctomycetaceae bacterium]
MPLVLRVSLVGWLIAATLSNAIHATEPAVDFQIHLDVALQELSPDYCWFHPRVTSAPDLGKDGDPLVVLTLQKHLGASDHYSGLYYMTSRDLGQSWTKPVLPKQLEWRQGEDRETIGVCDVTPGWHAASERILAIGTQLRYNQAGDQLMERPRSYDAAYAVYDPKTDAWTAWKTLGMPMGNNGQFHHIAPGCVQWLVQDAGSILLPLYYQGPNGGPYSVTIVHATFDGERMTYVAHGDELSLDEVRGLVEPSLTRFHGKYYLTLRNDNRGYVTSSDDGLHFDAIKPWTFDDGRELGSYNTQQHWVTHSDGLFLSYTRRGANNDHIVRNRAPLFVARVDMERLTVLRETERVLIPERGVMLGNFGVAAVNQQESWVTDSEFITNGELHHRGADGSTFIARLKWSQPNRREK